MNPHRAQKHVDEFDSDDKDYYYEDEDIKSFKYPSQLPPTSDGKNPHVMIAGAGIGGLFLAILLDRAGIPYTIYERASGLKALGSIMSLNASILPSVEQLGLLEEVLAISFHDEESNVMYENLKVVATFPRANTDDLLGYDMLLFPRESFLRLLHSKVPAERIHYGKKVMSIQQNKEGVMIRCADGTTYHGDVLVGADGAYSAVRQSLYKTLQQNDLLPASDAQEMSKGYMCLVGTTNPLNPEQFPFVKDRTATTFSQIIGRGTQFTWSELNVRDQRVCWVVIFQLESMEDSESVKFRCTEWGPETAMGQGGSAGGLVSQVRDFKVPGGGTIGNLIDATPDVCKVFLEDKLFETWYHGRTVLIGDAAHKLLPSAGLGASCAMQDAVILANCLYDLESLSKESIQTALQSYKEQRHDHVRDMFEKSKFNAIFFNGQTFKERLIRFLALNFVPQSVKTKALLKGFSYRPEISYLPRVPKRGKGEVLPQRLSKRYELEQEKQKATEKEGAIAKKTDAADSEEVHLVVVEPITAIVV
ncbi:hypothetical protein BGZ83_011725 [Gryganskiella cystojenkinii]|nr:hypothetical protein BGZ83_011725 [Gryganskiella cystojenkinii]